MHACMHKRLVVITMMVAVIAIIGVSVYVASQEPSKVSISDIRQHPSKYMGKQVVVEGFVSLTGYYQLPTTGVLTDTSYKTIHLINLPSGFTPIGGVIYRVTGIVITHNATTSYGWIDFGLTIDVTNIRLAD